MSAQEDKKMPDSIEDMSYGSEITKACRHDT